MGQIFTFLFLQVVQKHQLGEVGIKWPLQAKFSQAHFCQKLLKSYNI